jgi:hypothetical protein
MVGCMPVLLLIAGCTSASTGEGANTPIAEISSNGNAEQEAEISESGSPAGAATAEVIGGDETALREFIEHYVTGPGSTGKTTVLIGALSEDLPFNLPIPENTRVIGSVVSERDPQNTSILLETSLFPEGAEAFYKETLPEQGWSQPPDPNQGGFVASGGTLVVSACHPKSKSYQTLFTGSNGNNHTILQIWIMRGQPYSPCDDQIQGSRENEAAQMLPALTAPIGVRQDAEMSGGGSYGSDRESAFQSATLIGDDLTVAALGDHYNAQLEEAGWTNVTSGSSEDAAWSTRTLTDAAGQEWTAQLFIMRSAQQGRFTAWIQVTHEFEH